MKEDRADFFADTQLGQKAVVTEGDNGDLWIEGLAADFGVDSQDEAFEEGAFDQAVQDFKASGNMPLLFHHKPDQQLGEVVDLELRPEGLWMKARIDKPAHNSHPLYDVYTKVKRGTMKGLSVAGKFFRRMSPDGMKIYRANLRETSITPLPVNERTLVAAGQKAFEEAEIAPPVEEANSLKEVAADLKALMARLDAAMEQETVETSSDQATDGEIGADAPAASAVEVQEPAQTEEPEAAGTDDSDEKEVVPDETKASAPDDEEEKKDEKAKPALELIDFRPAWQDKLENMIDGKAETITFKAWDGRESRFTEGQYRRSCLIKGKGKDDSQLPVREPDGTLNGRAVAAAMERINQIDGDTKAISAARIKLDRLTTACERARRR